MATQDADESEGRDRSKAKRFKKLLETGSLPEQVLEAWSRCGSRHEQTATIKTLFKMENNRLVMTEDYTLPKMYQHKQQYTSSEAALSNKDGFGKLIFKKRNNLSEEELQECLRDGSVVKWQSGDIDLYAARNIQITKGAEKKVSDEMQGKSVELDDESSVLMHNAFTSMESDLKLEKLSRGKSSYALDSQPHLGPVLPGLARFSPVTFCCNASGWP